MREHPILMHSRSIDGICAGRKTQTRRIVKIPSLYLSASSSSLVKVSIDSGGPLVEGWPRQDREFGNFGRCQRIRCPYGRAGDRLWVRERFGGDDLCGYAYFADHPDWPRFRGDGEQPDSAWKPSIHMPRKASRLTLEVLGIRVERVQDISNADCKAEGIRKEELPPDPDNFHPPGSYGYVTGKNPEENIQRTPQEAFAILWDDTNGAGAWARNNWVWVVDFRRIDL